MKAHNNLFIVIVVIVNGIFAPQLLNGQSFIPIRVEGKDLTVKKDGQWANYSSAKKIGTLVASDSIVIHSAGNLLKVRDAENHDYSIIGPYKGTILQACDKYRNDRRNKNRYFILDFNNRQDSVGEEAMASRGDDADDYFAAIASNIIGSKREILSNSIAIRRITERGEYYYVINNKTSYSLYISIIEVQNGRFVPVDTDLLNMVVADGMEIKLSDYPLSKQRKRNSYYMVASFDPLISINTIMGKPVSDYANNRQKLDFNIIIAGHR